MALSSAWSSTWLWWRRSRRRRTALTSSMSSLPTYASQISSGMNWDSSWKCIIIQIKQSNVNTQGKILRVKVSFEVLHPIRLKWKILRHLRLVVTFDTSFPREAKVKARSEVEVFHPTFWRIPAEWPAWAFFNHGSVAIQEKKYKLYRWIHNKRKN